MHRSRDIVRRRAQRRGLVRTTHRSASGLTPHRLVLAGDRERHLERLFVIKPWVDVRPVRTRQIGLFKTAGATGAFGDILTRHLKMDTAEVGAFGVVYFEGLLELRQDILETPRLDAVFGLFGVAMHRVADPEYRPKTASRRGVS